MLFSGCSDSSKNANLSDEYVGFWLTDTATEDLDSMKNNGFTDGVCDQFQDYNGEEPVVPASYSLNIVKIEKSGSVKSLIGNKDGFNKFPREIARIDKNLNFKFSKFIEGGDLPKNYESKVLAKDGVLTRSAKWDGGESDPLISYKFKMSELKKLNKTLHSICK